LKRDPSRERLRVARIELSGRQRADGPFASNRRGRAGLEPAHRRNDCVGRTRIAVRRTDQHEPAPGRCRIEGRVVFDGENRGLVARDTGGGDTIRFTGQRGDGSQIGFERRRERGGEEKGGHHEWRYRS
jgi:hypothetical protein